MSEKIYCGSGKEFGQYGTINISICLDDIPPQFKKKSKNGKTYVNLKVQKKKQVDQYGKTHYIEIDTWEPTKQNNQPQNNQLQNNQLQNNQPQNNSAMKNGNNLGEVNSQFENLDSDNPGEVPF